MTDFWPRTFAIFSLTLGMVGAWHSLVFLGSPFTILFFLIGASVWFFFLMRSFTGRADRLFIAGWIWSILLHLALIPLSPLIQGLFPASMPVRMMLFAMAVLSVCGLVADSAYYDQSKATKSPTPAKDDSSEAK